MVKDRALTTLSSPGGTVTGAPEPGACRSIRLQIILTGRRRNKYITDNKTEPPGRRKYASPPLTFGAKLTTDNTKEQTKHNT
jgi:hypothetical protein